MRWAVRRLIGHLLVESTAGRRLDAVSAQALSELRPPEVDALLLAAARHGVTGLLGAAVAADDRVDGPASHQVQLARSRVLRDHLRAVGELTAVGRHLDRAGVPWLLVKGPALALAAYDQPHLREYTDLDVLVPADALPDALRALMDGGSCVDGPGLSELRRLGGGEIRLRSSGGLPIDLHWDLVNDPAVRRTVCVPDAAALLRTARPLQLPGLPVRTLDAVDTLLHVALHACTSGGWRLLWLRDTIESARAAARADTDVWERARAWRVELAVGAMVGRAERVLGVPSGLVRARPRPPWLHVLTAVDVAVPVQRTTGQPSLTRIVSRATRGDSASSAVELVRRSIAFARRDVG